MFAYVGGGSLVAMIKGTDSAKVNLIVKQIPESKLLGASSEE